MPDQRRPLLRLGATLLLISGAMGLAAAIPLSNPTRWMTAHVTAIMLGTLVMVEGLVWRDLRLSDNQRRWMMRLVYLSVWSGVALGIAAALMDIPGPATSPGVSPSGLQVPILATLLAIIVPTTIASWALLWIGLRGNEAGRLPVAE
jgi:putative Mn2+ efflux pump MntP